MKQLGGKCGISIQLKFNFQRVIHSNFQDTFCFKTLILWWLLREFLFYIQWNLCNPTKNYGPKVFLSTKIKPEYSNMLYNPTFPCSHALLDFYSASSQKQQSPGKYVAPPLSQPVYHFWGIHRLDNKLLLIWS
jgi:hypothetical protein